MCEIVDIPGGQQLIVVCHASDITASLCVHQVFNRNASCSNQVFGPPVSISLEDHQLKESLELPLTVLKTFVADFQ